MLKSLVQQSLGVMFVRVIGVGLSLGVTVLIARAWNSSALGIYSYIIALIALLAGPTSNGWSMMVVRETARKNAVTPEVASLALSASLFSGLTAVLTAGAAYVFIALLPINSIALSLQPVGLVISLLIGVVMFFDQLSSLRMAKLRGVNRPILGQMPETLIRPIILVASLGLIALFADDRLNNVQLFLCLAAASFLANVSGEIIVRRLGHNPKPAELRWIEKRRWIASALMLGFTGGLIQLNGYIDILLLGVFAEAEQIGHYRAALQIAMLSNFGFMALNFIAGQRFSWHIEQNDQVNLARSATHLSRLAFATALPVLVILVFSGPFIFRALFGSGFEDSALPAIILASGITINAAFGMPYALLVMKNAERIGIAVTLASVSTNAALCLVLIPKYGLLGAAIGNFSGAVLWVTTLWIIARRRFGLDMGILGLKSTIPNVG